jgi:ABC-type glycerol-3-phosphate transport system substrate-binding protein
MKRFVSVLAVLAICLPSYSYSKEKTPKTDVVIWHWMTDRQAAFEKLADRYLKEKGIRVLFESCAPSDLYKAKVHAAAGRCLPEIYSLLGDKRELASYINAGYIADLTDEMNKGWKDIFFEKALLRNAYAEGNEWHVKPGIYGAPIDVNVTMLYYNKTLFEQAGLDPDKPPETWEQFIETGVKLRNAGIQPFVSGFGEGEGWLAGVLASSYEWNLLGKDGVVDTINGKVKYTDPGWIRIFNLFDDMRKNNMYASCICALSNKEAETAFATGKAAMALNGSWAVNVYYGMNPNLDYGIIMPPKLEGAKYPMLVSGGEGSSLYVNPASPNKDKAIAFLKWLTEKDQQAFLTQETRNIPSNRDAAAELPSALKGFTENMVNTFEALPVTEHREVINAVNTGLQAIITGEKTPEQIADEVQKLKNSMAKVNAL